MKTDDLIRALAAAAPEKRPSMDLAMLAALVAAFAVSGVLFAMILGPRPDIGQAVETPRFLFKFVATLTLAVTAAAVVMRLARPAAPPGRTAALLWIGPALLAMAVAAELLVVPREQWMPRLVGNAAMVCFASIPVLAAPILAGALWALRNGAPTRPRLAGAAAGLLAGGLGATLYAAHCMDDSPLFLMAWYVPAVALVAAAGALAGARLLRW
ncbi:MAG: DUF1109 family protein [Rhizobiales bacterium]|nr:DUF1109 family protein [Hyphomicrobiales bacterium]